MTIPFHKKWSFYLKDFASKCDRLVLSLNFLKESLKNFLKESLQENADLVTFTEEILNGKLGFMCNAISEIIRL